MIKQKTHTALKYYYYIQGFNTMDDYIELYNLFSSSILTKFVIFYFAWDLSVSSAKTGDFTHFSQILKELVLHLKITCRNLHT